MTLYLKKRSILFCTKSTSSSLMSWIDKGQVIDLVADKIIANSPMIVKYVSGKLKNIFFGSRKI